MLIKIVGHLWTTTTIEALTDLLATNDDRAPRPSSFSIGQPTIELSRESWSRVPKRVIGL